MMLFPITTWRLARTDGRMNFEVVSSSDLVDLVYCAIWSAMFLTVDCLFGCRICQVPFENLDALRR